MNVVVYTDASYCEKTDIAACGYVILVDGKLIKHDVYLVRGLRKSSTAEIFSIVKALEYSFLINGVNNIVINTDHMPTIIRKKGMSHYEELDATVDIIKEYSIGISFFHVKGHRHNKYNNLVDKSCHHNLRKYLNKHKNEKSTLRRNCYYRSIRM